MFFKWCLFMVFIYGVYLWYLLATLYLCQSVCCFGFVNLLFNACFACS